SSSFDRRDAPESAGDDGARKRAREPDRHPDARNAGFARSDGFCARLRRFTSCDDPADRRRAPGARRTDQTVASGVAAVEGDRPEAAHRSASEPVALATIKYGEKIPDPADCGTLLRFAKDVTAGGIRV